MITVEFNDKTTYQLLFIEWHGKGQRGVERCRKGAEGVDEMESRHKG